MKKLIILLIAGLFCNIYLAHAESGSDQYFPTKLEWFVMELNSRNIFNDSSSDGFSITYYSQRPSTIVLSVNYFPRVKEDYMLSTIRREMKFLDDIVKIKEWDDINVKVETTMLQGIADRENKLKTFLAKE